MLYEISKTYDTTYEEDIKIAGLMVGNYISNGWSMSKKVDFYIVKGVIENLLNYMAF